MSLAGKQLARGKASWERPGATTPSTRTGTTSRQAVCRRCILLINKSGLAWATRAGGSDGCDGGTAERQLSFPPRFYVARARIHALAAARAKPCPQVSRRQRRVDVLAILTATIASECVRVTIACSRR